MHSRWEGDVLKHAVRGGRSRRWAAVTATFVVALLLFGMVVVLPQWFSDAAEEELSATDTRQGRERSLLLMIYDFDNRLTGSVAVYTDARTLSMRAVGYPPQTEVRRNNELTTLAACYADEGSAAAERLSAVTGERYDAVLGLSVSAIAAFVARSGNGITYTLAEPVGKLADGEQTLTSLQIADVLRYRGWLQSLTGSADAHSGIITAIINRFLVPQNDLTALFNRFCEVCEDKVSIATFEVVRDDLALMAKANDGGICRAFVPEGRGVGSGELRRYALNFQ